LKRRLSLLIVSLAVALVVVSGAGCLTAPFRRPSQTPSPKVQAEPQISLYLEDKGTKTSMSIEEYLPGVVAAEMGPDAPPEALAAQAILARTFTLQRIKQKGGTRAIHGTDACTDPDHFQAYSAAKVNDAVRNAVKATRGMIVTSGGAPVLAYFHSNSGGVTATALEGLNFKDMPTPYLTNVKDSIKDDAAWRHEFPTAEVMNSFRKLGKNVSTVSDFKIGKKGPSGRATEFTAGGQTVNAPEFRTTIGPDKLRSTLIDTVSVSGGKIIMAGKGWGHGVGMSQDGAKAMAQQGKKASDIITFYYKGVVLEKRWQ